jgi:hypothetical protein
MLLTFEDPPANIKVSENYRVTNSRGIQNSRVYFEQETVLTFYTFLVIWRTL